MRGLVSRQDRDDHGEAEGLPEHKVRVVDDVIQVGDQLKTELRRSVRDP